MVPSTIDPPTGDGAGILCAIPHDFFVRVVKDDCFTKLPAAGEYAIGQFFLPNDPELRNNIKEQFAEVVATLGMLQCVGGHLCWW